MACISFVFLSLCQSMGRNLILSTECKQWVCNTKKLMSELLTTASETTAGSVRTKWNAGKCVLATTKVSYFGQVLSDKGVQPDLKNIAAIQGMKPPRNKQELKTLHGIMNYLAKFTSNLAETTTHMRSLLKNDFLCVGNCL